MATHTDDLDVDDADFTSGGVFEDLLAGIFGETPPDSPEEADE